MSSRADNWQGMNWIRKDKRLAIYMRDHGRCVYCESQRDLSLDHLRTVSRGGNNEASNLVTACQSCNAERGAKLWWLYAIQHEGAAGRIQRQRRRSIRRLRGPARVALEMNNNNVTNALHSA
jgi:hypothetical protein